MGRLDFVCVCPNCSPASNSLDFGHFGYVLDFSNRKTLLPKLFSSLSTLPNHFNPYSTTRVFRYISSNQDIISQYLTEASDPFVIPEHLIPESTPLRVPSGKKEDKFTSQSKGDPSCSTTLWPQPMATLGCVAMT